MGPIKTVRENCRKCYSCVRNCPVKAIRVTQHYAEVIHERCIGCGKCIRVCSQKAKLIADCIGETERLLAGKDPVVAVLGCSYPAFFNDVRSGQLASGIKRLGFDEVHEGASGVELIRSEYGRLKEQDAGLPLISTHCPTIVDLIERHYPQLLRHLMNSVSPMVAIGRFIKARRGPKTRVVYISSCIAGKFEIEAEEVAGAIDVVLTYRELNAMLRDRGIDLTRLPETHLDGLPATRGRLFSDLRRPLPGLRHPRRVPRSRVRHHRGGRERAGNHQGPRRRPHQPQGRRSAVLQRRLHRRPGQKQPPDHLLQTQPDHQPLPARPGSVPDRPPLPGAEASARPAPAVQEQAPAP